MEEADLLVHVVDMANPDFHYQIEVVENLLKELSLDRIPCLKVYNKVDLVSDNGALLSTASFDGVVLSAIDRTSFGPFLERAQALMKKVIRK